MKAEDKEVLMEAGIDVADTLERFMGSEDLMMKFLLRFPQDESFVQMKQALEANNAEEAYKAAHSLKGLAGNLGMKRLFQAASAVVEDLRKGDLKTAQAEREAVDLEYQQVMRALQTVKQ